MRWSIAAPNVRLLLLTDKYYTSQHLTLKWVLLWFTKQAQVVWEDPSLLKASIIIVNTLGLKKIKYGFWFRQFSKKKEKKEHVRDLRRALHVNRTNGGTGKHWAYRKYTVVSTKPLILSSTVLLALGNP